MLICANLDRAVFDSVENQSTGGLDGKRALNTLLAANKRLNTA
jgi:hypothetical protein